MTLESERDAILALASDDDQDHWQIGVHYNTIVDHKLSERSGYRSAREFFARELKAIPQSTLSLYGSVARAYSEEHARKYGVSNLGRLLTYSALIHAQPPAPTLTANPRALLRAYALQTYACDSVQPPGNAGDGMHRQSTSRGFRWATPAHPLSYEATGRRSRARGPIDRSG